LTYWVPLVLPASMQTLHLWSDCWHRRNLAGESSLWHQPRCGKSKTGCTKIHVHIYIHTRLTKSLDISLFTSNISTYGAKSRTQTGYGYKKNTRHICNVL
jgi:hypothetical protein